MSRKTVKQFHIKDSKAAILIALALVLLALPGALEPILAALPLLGG